MGFCSEAYSQDCADPGLVCPLSSTDTVSSVLGAPVALPAGFCFDDAPNALFFEFNTLDLNQFPELAFDDGTAFLSLSIDSCRTDSLFSQGLNMAVFEASDLCDPATYGDPIACALNAEQSGQLVLTDLEPSTTYYVIVTGLFNDTVPDAIASDCAFRLSVAGPAVEYPLEADPPTAQNQSIFPGQSAQLEVNPSFDPYEWFGDFLNTNEGSSVTASPSEFGVYTYTVQTEINGCPAQETFLVTLVPPITPFNAFTPNADGFNDTWVIDRIQQFQNAQIFVYSRWGARVFQETNYKNDWDGDDLPAATYYFVIELNDPDNFDAPPITGSVTIIR
jgi:gliding motility-associated-like protein